MQKKKRRKKKNFQGSSFYANAHPLSDRGDTCSTLATWLVGGKGSLTELLNQFFSDGCVCRASQTTPGLLNMQQYKSQCKFLGKMESAQCMENIQKVGNIHTLTCMQVVLEVLLTISMQLCEIGFSHLRQTKYLWIQKESKAKHLFYHQVQSFNVYPYKADPMKPGPIRKENDCNSKI